MKIKIAFLFILGSIIFSACTKKQCPAYGDNTPAVAKEEIKA